MSNSHIILLPLIFQTISLVTSCDIENEVVNNYPLSNLDSWTECYNKAYNSAMGTTTKASSLPNCEFGHDILIFIGAKQSSSSNDIYVGAYGPSSVLTTNTDSTTIAYKPSMVGYPDYNVYWYNNIVLNPGSFGFAPNATIDLSIGDDFNPNDEQRLSWRLEGYGGRRAGSNLYLDWSSVWYKVVYYKQCEIKTTTSFPLISTTTAAATGCDGFDIENEVVNNYPLSNLDTWTECYNKAYNSAMGTTISSLPNCETGENIFIFVGAKSSSSNDYAYVGAYGPSSVLTTNTDSTSIAYKPSMVGYPDYGVYWYNNIDLNPGSFGFAPNSTIDLSIGDDFNPNDNKRLSWRLEGYGGRRAGTNTYLDWSSTWYKIVYYKECDIKTTTNNPATTMDATDFPLISTTSTTGCDGVDIENEVVNNYAISNLNGWTECYNKPYNSAMGTTASSSSLPNCETGDDIFVFVGAKSTSSSDEIYVGAFGPSSVLTTNTDSTTVAYKPSMSDYPDYDVYWYNNIDLNPGSFGFAPNATIDLSIGDDFNPNDEQRLSWRLEGYGGRRAGSNLYLDWSSTWYKVVYYKQCGDSGTKDIATTTTNTPKESSTTTTSIDVTNTGCDRLEYTYSYGGSANYLNIIPAGVCLKSIIGSEMYVCDDSSTMRELSWYDSDECQGEISYSESVAESLEFYDNVTISITCCTGNQCPYVDVVVYDFDDITDCTNSDDLDLNDGDVNLFSSEGPYVIGSCEYTNYGWWNYSTSYECLDGKFIEYEYENNLECEGAIHDTEEISGGDCYASTRKTQIGKVTCGTAIDTCGIYESTTTNTPTTTIIDVTSIYVSSANIPTPVYIIHGIIIGLVMFV